jgi:hypothetical protein
VVENISGGHGEPPETYEISERMGHSAVGITLDTYSHVLPGMQEDTVRLIDAALATSIKKSKADKA